MKNIKAVLVVIYLTSLSMLLAQPAGPPPQKMDMVKDLKVKLQLSDEQAKKVESIFTGNQKKIDSLFEKNNKDRQADRKKMDEIHKSTNNELEKILTKEQKVIFKEMMEKMDERMPPPPPQGLKNRDDRMGQSDSRFDMRDRMTLHQEGGCRCCENLRMIPPAPPPDGRGMMPLWDEDEIDDLSL